MSITFRIIPAANTCLYLPVHLAIRWKLYEHFLERRDYDVELVESSVSDNGDRRAIEQLPDDADSTDGVLAVCDPVEVININSKLRRQGYRILGAFIKKPCFWAIDRCEKISALTSVRPFNHLVRSNDNMQTGHLFGQLLHDEIEPKHGDGGDGCELVDAAFGQEIATLVEAVNRGANSCAVTADILGCEIVSRIDVSVGRRLKVFYSFADGPDRSLEEFVTTGFVVRRGALAAHREFLAGFVSAVSLASQIIDVAPESIEGLLQELAETPAFQAQSYMGSGPARLVWNQVEERQAIVRGVWERLVRERVYDPDLSISKAAWENALDKRKLGASQRTAGSELFGQIVVPDLAVEATSRVQNLLTRGQMTTLSGRAREMETQIVALKKTIRKNSEAKSGGPRLPRLTDLAATIFVALGVAFPLYRFVSAALANVAATRFEAFLQFGAIYFAVMAGIATAWFYLRIVLEVRAGTVTGVVTRTIKSIERGPVGYVLLGSLLLIAFFPGVPMAFYISGNTNKWVDYAFWWGIDFAGALTAFCYVLVPLWWQKHRDKPDDDAPSA